MTTDTTGAKHVESPLARQTLLDADLTRPGHRRGADPAAAVAAASSRSGAARSWTGAPRRSCRSSTSCAASCPSTSC